MIIRGSAGRKQKKDGISQYSRKLQGRTGRVQGKNGRSVQYCSVQYSTRGSRCSGWVEYGTLDCWEGGWIEGAKGRSVQCNIVQYCSSVGG